MSQECESPWRSFISVRLDSLPDDIASYDQEPGRFPQHIYSLLRGLDNENLSAHLARYASTSSPHLATNALESLCISLILQTSTLFLLPRIALVPTHRVRHDWNTSTVQPCLHLTVHFSYYFILIGWFLISRPQSSHMGGLILNIMLRIIVLSMQAAIATGDNVL